MRGGLMLPLFFWSGRKNDPTGEKFPPADRTNIFTISNYSMNVNKTMDKSELFTNSARFFHGLCQLKKQGRPLIITIVRGESHVHVKRPRMTSRGEHAADLNRGRCWKLPLRWIKTDVVCC